MTYYPLTWGLTDFQIKKEFPTAVFSVGYVKINGVFIRNFPADCGAVFLTGANAVSTDALKDVVKFCSMSGFSKIFATVVFHPQYSRLHQVLDAFKAARFKLVFKGKSNRNPEKNDYVFVKYIRNCKHKGY